MVSDKEKAGQGTCQVGTRETNVSELLSKRRKVVLMASKPGSQLGSGISLGEILLTAQAAPGVEAA